jgi:TRAP-type C4-dicarboxylate transport system permease small subunit
MSTTVGTVLRSASLRALDRVNTGVYYLIGALLAVISVVVMIQVLVRLVLTQTGINVAAPWTEELARFLLVWLVFLGAAVGCRRMQLISLEFVMRSLPAVIGRGVRYLALGLCLFLYLLLVRYGTDFAQSIGRSELSPVMQISKAWVYWAMPVGGILMLANTIAFVVSARLEGRDIRLASNVAETD